MFNIDNFATDTTAVTLSVYFYLHMDTFKYVPYQKKLQINFLCHVLILRKINYYKNSIVFHFVACNTWGFKLPGTLEVVILRTDVSAASKYCIFSNIIRTRI